MSEARVEVAGYRVEQELGEGGMARVFRAYDARFDRYVALKILKPSERSDPAVVARLGTLELRARTIVEGFLTGLHRSPFKGFSVEFAQHRPYVSGDDIRHLDWKVYGRSDKLHLKQYQQETNLDLVTLVDASGSMMYGSRSFEDASGAGQSQQDDTLRHEREWLASARHVAVLTGARPAPPTFSRLLAQPLQARRGSGRCRRR